MKKIVALVVILAGILAGSYYVTGQLAERAIKKDIQAFNRMQGLHVEIKEYHRSFFKSQAIFNWSLHIPEHLENTGEGQTKTVPATDLQSEMPLVIHHGPVIISHQGIHIGLASASTEFGLPEPYLAQYQQVFTPDSDRPKLIITLYINLLMKTDIRVAIPQFKAVTKNDQTTIQWKGLTVNTRSDMNLSRIDGDSILKGVQITSGSKSIEQGKLSVDYHLNQNDMGLYLGNAAIKIDSLSAKEGDNILFDLKQFKLESNNQVENKLFSVTINGALNKVSGNGKTFGPAKITITLANLDAETLVHIRDIAQNARQMTSPIQKNQAMLAILPELPKLLSHGPRLEIPVLELSTEDGILEGHLKVSLPENSGINMFELVQKIQGQAHLSIPEAMIKLILQPEALREITAQQNALPQGTQSAVDINAAIQTKLDNKIQNMTQSGLLMKKDNRYTLDVTFEKGQFLINDKPFNPAMMQF